MQSYYDFTCGDCFAHVYWVEGIPSKLMQQGWMSEVTLGSTSTVGISGDPDSGKSVAVILAKHLFEKAGVPIPECVSAPNWRETNLS
jgi:hypothetical protein